MADRITADTDSATLLATLDDLGPSAQPFINAAAQVTAVEILAEMRTRLARQLIGASKPTPSRPDLGQGLTLAGLTSRVAADGNGVVIVDERDPYPMLPYWIERGTKRHDPHSHTAAARPFFDISAQLSQGSHERRIAEALQAAIDAKGLGS